MINFMTQYFFNVELCATISGAWWASLSGTQGQKVWRQSTRKLRRTCRWNCIGPGRGLSNCLNLGPCSHKWNMHVWWERRGLPPYTTTLDSCFGVRRKSEGMEASQRRTASPHCWGGWPPTAWWWSISTLLYSYFPLFINSLMFASVLFISGK